jgi:urease accessory protein
LNAYGRLSVLRGESVLRNGKTVLRDLYFTAPLKILPPHPLPEGGITVTQLSVSAGLMAGDRQDIRVIAGPGTRMVWTSQASEKIHKMNEGGQAERECRFRVGPGAFLRYAPLPVIPFADSGFRGHTRFDLADASSRLVYSDIFCPGRAARGELFRFRRYRHLVEIYAAGELLYRDNTDFSAGASGTRRPPLAGPGMFEGYSHTASLVMCNTGLSLEALRQSLPANGKGIAAAATSLGAGGKAGLFVRALGNSAEALEALIHSAAAI